MALEKAGDAEGARQKLRRTAAQALADSLDVKNDAVAERRIGILVEMSDIHLSALKPVVWNLGSTNENVVEMCKRALKAVFRGVRAQQDGQNTQQFLEFINMQLGTLQELVNVQGENPHPEAIERKVRACVDILIGYGKQIVPILDYWIAQQKDHGMVDLMEEIKRAVEGKEAGITPALSQKISDYMAETYGTGMKQGAVAQMQAAGGASQTQASTATPQGGLVLKNGMRIVAGKNSSGK